MQGFFYRKKWLFKKSAFKIHPDPKKYVIGNLLKKGYTMVSHCVSKNPLKLIENSEKYFSTKLFEMKFLFPGRIVLKLKAPLSSEKDPLVFQLALFFSL